MRRSSTWRPASQFGHVSSLSIYERPDDPTYDPYTAWRDQIERRLHLLEPLRRRLREVPFGLDHPFWIEDPDVRPRLPRPPQRACRRRAPTSSSRELIVADHRPARSIETGRCGRPTSSRVCREDRFAILTKVHHATIDGASGAELLTMMLDSDPEGDEIDPPDLGVARRPRPERRRDDRAVHRRARAQARSSDAAHDPHGPRARQGHPQPGARRCREPGARASLRGPLGALLNIGRPRDARGRDRSARCRRSSRRRRRSTRRSRRTGASRSGRRRSTRSRRSRPHSARPSTTSSWRCAPGGLRT